MTCCIGVFLALLSANRLQADPQPEKKSTRQLPELLVDSDGKTILDAKSWSRRRAELLELFQTVEYGHLPPRPQRIEVTAEARRVLDGNQGTAEELTLTIPGTSPIHFRIALYLPPGNGPFPVIVREDVRLAYANSVPFFLNHGYAFLQYIRTDLDKDQPDSQGPAQLAYPDYDWATLAVWAWGAMRAVDYLETRPEIDRRYIAVTGHSRGGKAALLAGAFDERFSLVAPNGSGCGGGGLFRDTPSSAESLDQITDPKRFAYWFVPRLREYAGREDDLPIDQHELKALVAPRSLICLDSWDDRWANPHGTLTSSLAAQEVFDLLDASSRNGIHLRRGSHDWTPVDWEALHEFAQQQWFNKGTQPATKFDPRHVTPPF